MGLVGTLIQVNDIGRVSIIDAHEEMEVDAVLANGMITCRLLNMLSCSSLSSQESVERQLTLAHSLCQHIAWEGLLADTDRRMEAVSHWRFVLRNLDSSFQCYGAMTAAFCDRIGTEVIGIFYILSL